jgi:hypothetical protein
MQPFQLRPQDDQVIPGALMFNWNLCRGSSVGVVTMLQVE